MATKIWFTPSMVAHKDSTTEEIIAWIEDVRLSLIEVGLQQTADTGQFDASSFVFSYAVPGSGTKELANLVFEIDDPLSAELPLYIKITFLYGFAHSGDYYSSVGSRITVGTATDGSGQIIQNSAEISSVIGYSYNNNKNPPPPKQSFISVSKEKGFVGAVMDAGQHIHSSSMQLSTVAFFIERIPDESGSPTPLGFTLWGRNQNLDGTLFSNTEAYPFVNVIRASTVMASGEKYLLNEFSFPYFSAVNTLTTETFCVHAFHSTPLPVRANGLVAVKHSVSKGTGMEIDIYGLSKSNFLATDYTSGLRPCAATAQAKIAFLFE